MGELLGVFVGLWGICMVKWFNGDNFNYKWLHKWLDSLITSLESLETPLMDYEQSVAYQLQSIQSCQLPKYCCLFLMLV